MDLDQLPDDISANNLADTLLHYWGLKFDTELERDHNLARGSIHQYRKRKSTDIQTKIIIALLRDIAYLEKKAARP